MTLLPPCGRLPVALVHLGGCVLEVAGFSTQAKEVLSQMMQLPVCPASLSH